MALRASAGVLFLVCLILCFWPVVPFIVSRENVRLVFYVFIFFFFYIGEDFGFKMTVSSNKCKGNFPLSEWDDSFEISSIKQKLYWILQVSDPLNKFRGIKEKVFFFFYQTLGTKRNPFGLLLLNKMLQASVMCWGRSVYYWKHLRISSFVWWR